MSPKLSPLAASRCITAVRPSKRSKVHPAAFDLSTQSLAAEAHQADEEMLPEAPNPPVQIEYMSSQPIMFNDWRERTSRDQAVTSPSPTVSVLLRDQRQFNQELLSSPDDDPRVNVPRSFRRSARSAVPLDYTAAHLQQDVSDQEDELIPDSNKWPFQEQLDALPDLPPVADGSTPHQLSEIPALFPRRSREGKKHLDTKKKPLDLQIDGPSGWQRRDGQIEPSEKIKKDLRSQQYRKFNLMKQRLEVGNNLSFSLWMQSSLGLEGRMSQDSVPSQDIPLVPVIDLPQKSQVAVTDDNCSEVDDEPKLIIDESNVEVDDVFFTPQLDSPVTMLTDDLMTYDGEMPDRVDEEEGLLPCTTVTGNKIEEHHLISFWSNQDTSFSLPNLFRFLSYSDASDGQP